MLTSTTGSKNPLGFAGGFGYREDDDTGLKLLGYRLYDPSIGRFLELDFGHDGSNWYDYCDNHPLKAIDADGLKKQLIVCLGDAKGLEAAEYNLIQYILEKFGKEYDVKILLIRNTELLEEFLSTAEAAILIGHGSSTSGFVVGDGKTFNTAEIRSALRKRKHRGKDRLDFVHILACSQLTKAEWRAAWLAIAYEVMGSAEFDWPGSYRHGSLESADGAPGMTLKNPVQAPWTRKL